MKNIRILIGIITLSMILTGCTSAYYQSTGSGAALDDMYGTHDKVAIAKKQQAQAEAQKAAAEARRAEWEARLAESQASTAEDNYYSSTGSNSSYQSVVADDYESAYARRLRGFESGSYNMPSSYYSLQYSDDFRYATAYDPAFYNVMVMGDQVWVEPRYITSMFGSWGRSSLYNSSWYFGWGYTPSYAGWGYPRYSWWDWNWNTCYRPYYDSWWGWGSSWGHHHHYPSWGYPSWGGGGGSYKRPDIVHRPSYTSPTSGGRYGSSGTRYGNSTTTSSSYRDNSGRGNSSFGVRGSGSGSTSGTRNTGGNSTSTYDRGNRGSSSTYDRGNRGSSSYDRGGSTSTYDRGSSSSSGGGYRGGSSGGSSGSSGGGGGRNAGGR